MGKFRKKPVVIEAVQLRSPGETINEPVPNWFLCDTRIHFYTSGRAEIETLEGRMHAEPGDWIIKGVKGEFYPCKPDIFAATYEPVE